MGNLFSNEDVHNNHLNVGKEHLHNINSQTSLVMDKETENLKNLYGGNLKYHKNIKSQKKILWKKKEINLQKKIKKIC